MGSIQYDSSPCLSHLAQKIGTVFRQSVSPLWVRWILNSVCWDWGGHLGQEMPSSGQLLYLEDNVAHKPEGVRVVASFLIP